MHRRFMSTTAGRVGLAHWAAEQGDKICVLLGCSVPLIIRREGKEDRYELIGECYVHGKWKGKLWIS
jgi:hypothetical protein